MSENGVENKGEVEFKFLTFEDDPNHENIKKLIDDKREEIKAKMFESADFKGKFEKGEAAFVEFEFDGYIVCSEFDSRGNIVGIEIFTKEFIDQRRADIDKLMGGEREPPKVSVAASRMGMNVSGLRDFSVKDAKFKVDKVEDALGRGLDPNIVNLVGLLNQLGIKTTGSCGGHEKEGEMVERLPYLTFNFDQLENVLRLGFTMKEVTGVEWNIGSIGYNTVGVSPALGTKLKDAQTQLKKLDEYLTRNVEVASGKKEVGLIRKWLRKALDRIGL